MSSGLGITTVPSSVLEQPPVARRRQKTKGTDLRGIGDLSGAYVAHCKPPDKGISRMAMRFKVKLE
jgi:hypothetical protein